MSTKSSRAKFTVDSGMIGSLPCEKRLTRVLSGIADRNTLQQAMRIYNSYKSGLKNILQLYEQQPKFALTILDLWHKDYNHRLISAKDRHSWDDDIYSCLRCCVVAHHRITLESMREHKNLYSIAMSK